MTRERILENNWRGYTYFLVSGARGKVWGSDEVNVEGWKALKRLPGHESGTS